MTYLSLWKNECSVTISHTTQYSYNQCKLAHAGAPTDCYLQCMSVLFRTNWENFKGRKYEKDRLELWKSPESSLLSCQIVWKKASQVSTSRHTFQYCDHLNVPLILQLLSILTLAHLDPRSTFCQKLIKKWLQSLVVIPIATSLSSVPLIWCDVESFSLLQFLVCDITKLS